MHLYKQLLATLFVALSLASAGAQTSADSSIKKISLTDYIIQNFYVDTIDANKLAEDAIRGMLEELDPHSSYLTPDEVKEMNEPLEGNFDGIGIQFNMNHDTLYVVQTIAGGPSERAGILAGDRIIAVNDTTIAGEKLTTTNIMKRLRGKKGTKVNVTVLRKSVPEPIEFRITRDKIPIHSIDAAYIVAPKVGYIRMSRFGATTHDEFLEAMKKLEKQGMKKLIVDLQGNGGGYLHTAVKIADELLDKEQLIVYTEGRRSPRDEAIATKGGSFDKGQLILLIDESSASASEILSGAVQDWDRGVVIGRRSFGKGLVQRQFPLQDESMLRLTIARYYTPSGRSIQRPYEDGNEAYNNEVIARYNSGELTSADSIHFPDSLHYTTLVTGRTVYGGGGIMPDIFVPLDTTRYTDYHRNLVAKGAMTGYNITYIEQTRDSLKQAYPTADLFIEGYTATPQTLTELATYAEKEGVALDSVQFETSQPLIALQLKALIARDLFDMEAYYRVMNETNNALQKAIEVMDEPKVYKELLGR